MQPPSTLQSRFGKQLLLASVLAFCSIVLSMGILFAIIFAVPNLQWVLTSFLLRGSVIFSWVMAFLVVPVALIARRTTDPETFRHVMTGLLILEVLLVIGIFVAGIDLTDLFTSPKKLLSKFGDIFTKSITQSKYTPRGIRGGSGQAVFNTIGEIGSRIAATQLIGALPFPYNMILFFIYQKFLTFLLLGGIPTTFAAWSAALVFSIWRTLWRERKQAVAANDMKPGESLQKSDERRPLLVDAARTSPPVLMNTTNTDLTLVSPPVGHTSIYPNM